MRENIIMEESMIVMRDPITFCFNFDFNVDENLMHEIELIVKSNESSSDNKIKNEIEQLLLKWNGNNIHEKSKTAKQMSHISLFLICHKE